MYDVIIVGGGPAGLSAALILGRCRRRVLVCDSGRYRNAASHAMHGFLGHDGVNPADLRRISREQLRPYDVEIRDVAVTGARQEGNHFEVELATGDRLLARKIVLATGLADRLPDVPGIQEMYGKSVFHCPYCDGWEVRDKPLAVYGRRADGVRLALTLRTWSSDVVLCTDGPAEGLTEQDAALLARRHIAVVEERIVRLEGRDGMLEHIVHEGGSLPRSALFLKTSPEQRSDLAAKLRCAVDEHSGVEIAGRHEETHVKGVFVAGDASKDLLLAVVAAAEGASAAFGINCELQDEELAEVSRGGG